MNNSRSAVLNKNDERVFYCCILKLLENKGYIVGRFYLLTACEVELLRFAITAFNMTCLAFV